MHIDVTALISQYGYWALFFGCLAEGETFTLLGGVAAHEGLLQYGWVLLIAVCGGTVGDCALFFIGRRYGSTLLQRFHRHQHAISRAEHLIHRHPVLFVIGVRFMYGLRIVGPIIIGASQLSRRRFLLLNVCSAVLWGLTFVSLGYVAGQFITPWLHALEHHLRYLVWLLLAVAGVTVVRIVVCKKRSKQTKH